MSESPPSQIQQLPPGILDALQHRQNIVRSSRLLSDFPNGVADLTNTDGKEGVLVNKFDLLCPKADCGSVILKNDVAKWVEQPSIQVNSCFPSFEINTKLTNGDIYSCNLRITQFIQIFHLSQCHQKPLNGG